MEKSKRTYQAQPSISSYFGGERKTETASSETAQKASRRLPSTFRSKPPSEKRARFDPSIPDVEVIDLTAMPDAGPKSNLCKTEEKDKNETVLSKEQQFIADLILNEGESLFFTGAAGAGKSFLLRFVIEKLRAKFKRMKSPDALQVTASTGIAACNIAGRTVHSFVGLGLAQGSPEELLVKLKRNRLAKKRWLETQCLIVDEVSMIDGKFFDTMEYLARKIRGNDRPFGGIQVILCGDFFQLPPVQKKGATESQKQAFCFQANSWKSVIRHSFELTRVYRQKDENFVKILNELRMGRLSDKDANFLESLKRPLSFDDGIEATELYSLRREVEKANNQRLARIEEPLFTFTAEDQIRDSERIGDVQKQQLKSRLDNRCLAPVNLELKKGAQVMLLINKNQQEGLVNGSLGLVVGFRSKYPPDSVQFIDNFVDHRTEAEKKEFDENGGTHLSPEKGGNEYTEMLKKPETVDRPDQSVDTNIYPVVRFVDGSEYLIEPHAWDLEENGKVVASRVQIPLMLAWAMSIHKSQGQTIQRLRVDLHKVFEKGQAYVAISRAVSASTLQIVNFNRHQILAQGVHPRVVEFYATLQHISTGESATSHHTESHMSVDEQSYCSANDSDQDMDVLLNPIAHQKNQEEFFMTQQASADGDDEPHSQDEANAEDSQYFRTQFELISKYYCA